MKFLFLLLLISTAVKGQDCEKIIPASPKTLDLNFKIALPCNWVPNPPENFVARYSYETAAETFMGILGVYDLGGLPTKEDLKKVNDKQAWINSAFKTGLINGDLLSAKTIKIDNINGFELVLKVNRKLEGQAPVYTISNCLISGDKLITIVFGVLGRTEGETKNIFFENVSYFRKLAAKIDVAPFN